MSNSLVSVIVPSYNYSSYLDARLESILNQTYKNIEVIIIDDCSTDDSGEVLRKYISNPRVTLVAKEKNSGWISINNQGVELASGEYILFAQCDDVCENTMIERLVEKMIDFPSAGLAFCRSHLVDVDDKLLGDDYASREPAFKELCAKDVLIHGPQMSRFLMDACVIPNLSAVLIRKECFTEVGVFSHDYKVCSDWDWYFKVAKKFDISYVSEPLNYFMQHKTTIRSSTKQKIIVEEYLRLLLQNLKLINLTKRERFFSRLRVMGLWSEYLLPPSFSSISSFPYHFSRVMTLDCLSLLFLPFALILRVGTLMKKIAKLLRK